MYFFGRYSILLPGTLFLCHYFISYDRNLFLWYFARKCGTSNKDFVWGFKILCQPGWQVDRDYPTLVCVYTKVPTSHLVKTKCFDSKPMISPPLNDTDFPIHVRLKRICVLSDVLQMDYQANIVVTINCVIFLLLSEALTFHPEGFDLWSCSFVFTN